MSLYDFDPYDVERFASFTGTRTRKIGNQLQFEICPFCHGETKSSKRDTYTFAINLDNGLYNCLRSSCMSHGNMIELAKQFPDFKLNDQVSRYLGQGEYRRSNYKPYNYHLEKPKDEAVEYLKSRGIDGDLCKKYDITMKGDNKTLIIPFRDENGVVWCVKFRNTKFRKDVDSMKEWFDVRKVQDENGQPVKDMHSLSKPILFGMYQCEGFKQLVITEGQMDTLACVTAGVKNVVSVPTGQGGATWIPYCYDWLTKFEEIVVFGDCENGKITLSDMIRNRFSRKRVKIVRVEDYKGCKDANDLLMLHGKQAVLDAVNNAQATVSKYIKRAIDIKYVDIKRLPRISTGITKLDTILSGGFYYGQLILLSGKKGNGKSTMASQFVVEALSQKKRALIYSGELPDYRVKQWVDGQMFGKVDLTNTQIKQCEDLYSDKLLIYDNTVIEEQPPKLLDVIEDTIIKQDVKFILIDNLMSGLRVRPNENLYQAQSDFVFKLARIAKQYDTVIMLVAHPRKTNGVFDNDDVSGSADITNLADIVMSYDRDKDREEVEDLRIMRITKNRLTGKLGNMELWFSESSRRISDNQRFDKNYFDGFIDSDDMGIPF